ncbi:hypothetical protein [Arthrobacter zhaoguopingii]|uniref:hypothetical protein n=1 Tax=Arthrobacter zhaoguopingii TaxID=2681491 RepID=UPI0013584281|nr:hypothetical protein [Arthrobacter zhaoguopingii]
MVSLPTSPEGFLALLAKESPNQPVLSSADLGRVSRERHQGQESLTRDAPSVGALRLSGAGVTGHVAALDDVTLLGLSLQRLITAIGAALKGFKNVRGRVPKELSTYTTLGLRAAPRPGSLILDLSPRISPSEELRGKGEVFSESDTQLVDAVIERLSRLLQAAREHQGGADETAFSSEIRELGPRAASALRGFAQATSASNFNVDLTWAQPLHETVECSLTPRDALWLEKVIAGRKLDAEPIVIHGALQTVSHGKKWDLLNSEFGNVSIDVTDIEGRPWSEWNPDDLVEVDASITITQSPGRAITRSIVARTIRPWSGSLADIQIQADDTAETDMLPIQSEGPLEGP